MTRQSAEPDKTSYRTTAQFVAGDLAAIAYSVQLLVRGPNGEAHQAFVLCSRDRGVSWAALPLVRTIGSHLRFWGFPVWPPESIDAIDLEGGLLRVRFRDEWVPFEPGGESLWTGIRRTRGLWTVARVRLMDYDHADVPAAAPPIEVSLPSEIAGPPRALVEAVASGVARDAPSTVIDRYGWLIAVPAASGFAIWGPSWRAVAILVPLLVALPLASTLTRRRRIRRACTG